MLLAVLSGFLLAAIAPLIVRVGRRASGWLISLLPVGLFIYFARFTEVTKSAGVVTASHTWVPHLGLDVSFYLDGLSILFALLITGIGALVMIYSGGYLAHNQDLGRYYAYILVFMAAMIGVVTVDNLLVLFIFWELTSISSFLLIGFDHERAAARDAALQALLVTAGGGLALLTGFLLLGQTAGTFQISALADRAGIVQSHGLYQPVLFLIVVGAATKSALVPFYFWLPAAMEAPTPVSAYLHSATMVNAGIYLLARLSVVLGGTDLWFYTLAIVGGATMLVGGYLAVNETDLKRILAYSTVSALGTLVLLLAIRAEHAATAAVVFLVAHALYKGSLFMVTGAIDHETGTRDVEQLGGLWRRMPFTAAAAFLAAISLAGIGPVLSFIGKELLLETVLEAERVRLILVPTAVLTAALFVTVAAIVYIRPFFGRGQQPRQPVHEAPFRLWLGPLVLSLAGLAGGLAPNRVGEDVVVPAVASVLGRFQPVSLTLWHGVNPALALSVVSLIVGAIGYAQWSMVREVITRAERLFGWGPARVYRALWQSVAVVADVQIRMLQTGYLRFYMATILMTTVVLVSYTMLSQSGYDGRAEGIDIRFYEAFFALLILGGALAAIRTRSRLTAVAAVGVVGYAIALIFLLFGAPDLAMTQILIESLTVILFVLVFYHLPPFTTFSSMKARMRDAGIAIMSGIVMAVLVLMATSTRFHPPISNYYVAVSLPQAHGRNIVNVILVDFRSLDTLGEITVLVLAAIGVYALLRLRLGPGMDE